LLRLRKIARQHDGFAASAHDRGRDRVDCGGVAPDQGEPRALRRE
jgi:hypothetical protein